MSKVIVHALNPITLVGGGQATAEDLAEALTIAPRLVAVDGGLAVAQAAGAVPEAVVGDMDSAPPEALAAIPEDRQLRVSEQQTTDFDKALRHVDAPVVLGVGFTGGRIDHHLAAYHTIALHADRPCILIAAQEIIVLAPPRIALSLDIGETVSLFPLLPCTGRSGGLAWPIEGLKFDPGIFIGTSNRVTGPVVIEMDLPGMLLILDRRHLRQVAGCFGPDAARWPVRSR